MSDEEKRLLVEAFGKIWAVVEGKGPSKYGIYHCGSKEECEAWIEAAIKRNELHRPVAR